MGKLHYCLNGESVTKQVLKYQSTHKREDYEWIQLYYNDYKDCWYSQVSDFIDRESFESDFDYKLFMAIDTFQIETANEIAVEKGYTQLGAFNGWFYKILSNWKSNIKTNSFRFKKRPPVQCPICGRFVGRIDADHLQHYKTLSDLPKYFVYNDTIYETSVVPRVSAVSWGLKTANKWKELQNGNNKEYTKEKVRVDWPWFLENGEKGVMCPFTKKVVSGLSLEYIQGLNKQHSRYATPVDWEEFVRQYPKSLIQNEIYSLDRDVFDSDRHSYLKDYIPQKPLSSGFDYLQMCSGKIPAEFEHSFRTIDNVVSDNTNRTILKLVAIGYSVNDIEETLCIDRKEIRKRIRGVREYFPSDELLD